MRPKERPNRPNDPLRDEPEDRQEDIGLPQTTSPQYQREINRICAKDCRPVYSVDPLNSSAASRLLTDH